MEKKYWKSLEELHRQEEGPALPVRKDDESWYELLLDKSRLPVTSRRDFLKWCGISFASATLVSACENPVKKAIPYVIQPEEIVPGKALWYASSYVNGNEYCSILVKTRDGRPIKIEGNPGSPLSEGGTYARVQASVLSLYDDGARYKHPTDHEYQLKWETVDREIVEALTKLKNAGKRCALVTPTVLSPSTSALIREFTAYFGNINHIVWDALSYAAIRNAYKRTFGIPMIPDYRFDRAEIIVSFSADFLGTWLAPDIFGFRYSKTRKIDPANPKMSHHVQFESRFSLTGANADQRIPVSPAEEIKILIALYQKLSGTPVTDEVNELYDVEQLVGLLRKHQGKCLVVSGHNNSEVQILINAINELLGSYGNTLDISRQILAGNDNEAAFEKLLNDLLSGEVSAVMFYQTNPVYHHHDREKVVRAIKNAELSISFSNAKDETAEICKYIIPDNHYLESWNDAEFVKGYISLMQPAIRKIYDTRQFQDSLLVWMGRQENFYSYIRNFWKKEVFPKQSYYQLFDEFWQHSLQKGLTEIPVPTVNLPSFQSHVVNEAISLLREKFKDHTSLQFCLYPTIALGDGHCGNNPWLQELPDPISSVTWDNFAAISPEFARNYNLQTGDYVLLNEQIKIPVLIQPGQANNCISMAVGYGRTAAGKAGNNVGVNVFPLVSFDGSHRQFIGNVQTFRKIGHGHVFAMTQTHFDMEGRPIIRESTLARYKEDPRAGNEIRDYHKKHLTTLYPETKFEGHHWALVVDLNACTGCSNCVIACQSENNVPVIGKKEVSRRRIMHWMRIDRYYSNDEQNPEVVFQPMMCQHCDHAPCENVCPVAATNHSNEGINQMAYNRCVGTKYCINNCPYKVRRFNWFRYAQNDAFDFNMNSDLGRMVLNPDVTVRERGVVEKCSFCIQRIQEGKLKAKNERRPLRDGEIQPACVQSCPAKALVFGDVNDPESKVARLLKDSRNYHVLEEFHTLPSVGYLTKIRNKKA